MNPKEAETLLKRIFDRSTASLIHACILSKATEEESVSVLVKNFNERMTEINPKVTVVEYAQLLKAFLETAMQALGHFGPLLEKEAAESTVQE